MRKNVQVEERVQKHLNKATVFFGFLVLALLLGAGFALWSVSQSKFVAPVATETNTVTMVVAGTNNLVPSGTNTSDGISFKGKVQSGWGESNNK